MFSTIKTYIYAACAGILLIILGWARYLSNQNKSLKKEVAVNKQNIVVLEKKASDKKEVEKVVNQVRQEAEVIQNEINTKRNNKSKPNVGDKFGDRRL